MRVLTKITLLVAVSLAVLLLAACTQVASLPDEGQIALTNYIEQHSDSRDNWRIASADQISNENLRDADHSLGAAWCVEVEWANNQPDDRYLVYRFKDDVTWEATLLSEPDTAAAQAAAPLCK